MQKPKGYDEAQVTGERERIELGGHYCTIKQVSERASSTGKPMVVVLFDFCAPDKQEGFFMKAFKNDIREDKKWPFQGTKYIMVQDYNDPSKTSRAFKTFCSCVEKSNSYEVRWDIADWGKQFVGKKIGAVYGDEEQEYNGKTFMREVMKWFCNLEAVETANIPETKYLPTETAPVSADSFMSISEDSAEEIPF